MQQTQALAFYRFCSAWRFLVGGSWVKLGLHALQSREAMPSLEAGLWAVLILGTQVLNVVAVSTSIEETVALPALVFTTSQMGFHASVMHPRTLYRSFVGYAR
eukprot:3018725-Amphidinium_carterae.1